MYASLQAILYGPFLLAGLSNGDYDIQTGPVDSVSDWITPVPSHYNSRLVSLAQDRRGIRYFLRNQNQVIKMQATESQNHSSYVQATFRIILKSEILGKESVIDKYVMLEPFDFPGTVFAYRSHEPANGVITVTDYSALDSKWSAEFVVLKGLNGENETVSFRTKDGCFLYSGVMETQSDTGVRLNCTYSPDKEAVSFLWIQGLKSYSSMSFVAKGSRRSYILEPLLGLQDESYNVYFNITKY